MKIAEYAVAAAPALLVTIGLGSCVAIVLHDAKTRVGALAHVLLPAPTATLGAADQPGRFPSSAVPRMLDEMRALGSSGTVTARLVGGASLFGPLLTTDGASVGTRNIAAARAALAEAKVRVIGEVVGGNAGRSVFFEVASGRVDVRSMREGDRVL